MKTHTNLPHSAVLFGALVLGLAPALASANNTTYYVKPDGDDTADGTSWDTAFRTAAKGFSMANTASGNTGNIRQGAALRYHRQQRDGIRRRRLRAWREP